MLLLKLLLLAATVTPIDAAAPGTSSVPASFVLDTSCAPAASAYSTEPLNKCLTILSTFNFFAFNFQLKFLATTESN